ncbi:hypothetical protein O181_024358 [Austropuccinia psidii MF-1]|uniref:Uncharacterized protein n=1 Tax=Austropuccinia psidii MF-1 TaxID=1389203 RepID=A0A9Q3GY55_9BASI|nr:hypothetical protein [Austropuccinia psidii MF-1]
MESGETVGKVAQSLKQFPTTHPRPELLTESDKASLLGEKALKGSEETKNVERESPSIALTNLRQRLRFKSNSQTTPVPQEQKHGQLLKEKEADGLTAETPVRIEDHELSKEDTSRTEKPIEKVTTQSGVTKSAQTLREEQEELQAAQDYKYGTSYGPGGKFVKVVWRGLKQLFHWLSWPIRKAAKPYMKLPSKVKDLNEAQTEVIRKAIARNPKLGEVLEAEAASLQAKHPKPHPNHQSAEQAPSLPENNHKSSGKPPTTTAHGEIQEIQEEVPASNQNPPQTRA